MHTAQEAFSFGLANRIVPKGKALETALALGEMLSNFPQSTMLADRRSAREQWCFSEKTALDKEFKWGHAVLGDAVRGAKQFADGGEGRGGSFDSFKHKHKQGESKL